MPRGHWKTLTLIAALRHDRVDARCAIDGPINGDLFTAHVEQVLVPTLAPGDIVVLDHLGSHKGQRARHAPGSISVFDGTKLIASESRNILLAGPNGAVLTGST